MYDLLGSMIGHRQFFFFLPQDMIMEDRFENFAISSANCKLKYSYDFDSVKSHPGKLTLDDIGKELVSSRLDIHVVLLTLHFWCSRGKLIFFYIFLCTLVNKCVGDHIC